MTRRREKTVRVALVALGVLALAIVSWPVIVLDGSVRRARACFAGAEAPWVALDCGADTLAVARWAPWTARPAQRVTEEIAVRAAVAHYVAAAVVSPDRAALRARYPGLWDAYRLVQGGSGRQRFDELGAPVSIPEPGDLAFRAGDAQTLVDDGERYHAWAASKHALEASLLLGQRDRAAALARRYETSPAEELVLDAAALLCLDGESERGAAIAQRIATRWAEKRSANFRRDFGQPRVLVEACAALEGKVPPPAPSYQGAGRLDHLERLAALRLRVAEGAAGCDVATGGPACAAEGAVGAAVDHLVTLLARETANAYRFELLALVAPALGPARAAELARPGAGERPLDAWLPLTVLELLAAAGPADAPYVAPDRWLGAAGHLVGLAVDDDDLAVVAGLFYLRAAAGLAAAGEAAAAAEAAEQAGERVAPGDALAGALVRALVADLAGEPERGLSELEAALALPAGAAAPSSRAAAVPAAAWLLVGELRLALGDASGAARALAVAIGAADDLGAGRLSERARWLQLAVAPPAVTAPPPARLPFVGPFDPLVPAFARRLDVEQALASWAVALSAGPAERVAFRHDVWNAPGDLAVAPEARALLAGRLVDEPAQVEPWLDAFFAIDARRWRQQGRAWIRAQAARWRGDGGAAALWTARLRTLAGWSHEPGAGELAQHLRL